MAALVTPKKVSPRLAAFSRNASQALASVLAVSSPFVRSPMAGAPSSVVFSHAST
ncbi:MAG: hypothetical protein KC668_22180 [Myxococcales bacterium]|nr:hypothetical protein [Myxococcales bacterium]